MQTVAQDPVASSFHARHAILATDTTRFLQPTPSNRVPFTKLFATLGPSTNTYETIRSVIEAGATAIRMNFSHGTHESHTELYNTVRKVSADLKKEVAVMVDLQGPKLRCNRFPGGSIHLHTNATIDLVASNEMGNDTTITTPFEPMITHCQVGEPVLLDDGYIRLVISEKKSDRLVCKVIQGGELKDKKGINLPMTDLGPMPALSEKDRADVEFALSNFDTDYFALSFVRNPEDVMELKALIAQHGKKAQIFAKIEKPESIRRLDDIIAVSDGILYARGDLAVEIGIAKVPFLQKHVTQRCQHFGVPICICTQMLESMTKNLAPTRAEASDVCNAVFDGADAVMLSGECASGSHPTEAVRMMIELLNETEIQLALSFPAASSLAPHILKQRDEYDGHDFQQGSFEKASYKNIWKVCASAVSLVEQNKAKLIACVPSNSFELRSLSSLQPQIPVIAISTDKSLVRTTRVCRSAFGIFVDKEPSEADLKTILVNEWPVLFKEEDTKSKPFVFIDFRSCTATTMYLP
ncbi:Pyruvate kinase [Blattamonas nauphoetae]|uniref:Pyruvate kinase n=1 Tax=Blattamonas nauphoetae TaxID=2049346 RepID=A0ABQ9X7G4_9EUKA|nr:Pyruvate kinase [Blattamonas nauphoetae]